MKNIFDLIPDFGKKSAGEYYCRENCYMRLFENTDENDFEEYIETLSENGFAVCQKRSTDSNLFAALEKDVAVTVLFTPCDGKTRITASAENRFPPFRETECAGDCRTTFYAFENDQTLIDCGMCLMIQCPDYSFFVVDSGHYFQMNDNDRIHRFMRERTPDGQKIVINGWFISHAHTDHISKLIDFLKYNTDDVVIEGFYQNLLPTEYPYERDNHEETEMADKLFKILEEYPSPVYKLHTGQRFYIRNLTFDVLYTFEDAFPEQITDYNDTSCVITVCADGSKVFIPGDAAELADKILRKRYGDALQCDVVQVAHHGHTGLSADCYSLIGADTAIFPVTRIIFEQEYERQEANRRAIEIADSYYITGDGTVCIPLPYKRGSVAALPDETFEDFEKIKRIWRYVYTDEYKQKIYDEFLAHGGNPEKLVMPTSKFGWIEPKPPIQE